VSCGRGRTSSLSPLHLKAMRVILTTNEGRCAWMRTRHSSSALQTRLNRRMCAAASGVEPRRRTKNQRHGLSAAALFLNVALDRPATGRQHLTRGLATPPAVSSLGGLRTPAPRRARDHHHDGVGHPQTFTLATTGNRSMGRRPGRRRQRISEGATASSSFGQRENSA
jgi:hypothetical protein